MVKYEKFQRFVNKIKSFDEKCTNPLFVLSLTSTYWNQGYGYQQGYGPGYGGSDYFPHGYYGYGPGYYYSNPGFMRSLEKKKGLPGFLWHLQKELSSDYICTPKEYAGEVSPGCFDLRGLQWKLAFDGVA
ncbi:E3 Ubiquitin-Protein Ligase Trim38 [Manis pentadactyla]|nr:E3 Ubiquitin-Protein Ligase Trim38 [Manis pentadactyla]